MRIRLPAWNPSWRAFFCRRSILRALLHRSWRSYRKEVAPPSLAVQVDEQRRHGRSDLVHTPIYRFAMGLLCCRRRHGFLPAAAAAAASFPLPATVRPSLCFAVAVLFWICCYVVVSLDQKPSLCACRARSWSDAASLPGHGGLLPCVRGRGTLWPAVAVRWPPAAAAVRCRCVYAAAVCLLPRGCLAGAGRCVPHDVCLPILVLR